MRWFSQVAAVDGIQVFEPRQMLAGPDHVTVVGHPVGHVRRRLGGTVNDVLLAFGMDAAYGGDYSAINPALSLSSVEQAGFVAVNEIGTEAAAATVAEFSDSASEAPFGPVIVDRPFLWFIRDVETGAVLFAGVVVDPR